MSKLSPEQIAGVAKAAGFTGNAVVWAVAICLAESAGDPACVSVNHHPGHKDDGSRDRGLMQINSYWHSEVSDAVAFSADGNMRAAHTISHGGRNWTAWTTYHNGTAVSFLPRARMAAAKPAAVATTTPDAPATSAGVEQTAGLPTPWGTIPLPGGNLPNLPGLPNPLDGVKSAAQSLALIAGGFYSAGRWLGDRHNMVRIIEVAGGIAALFAGLHIVANNGTGPAAAAAGAVAHAPSKAARAYRKTASTAGQAAAAVATDGASVAATGAAKAASKAATVGKGTR